MAEYVVTSPYFAKDQFYVTIHVDQHPWGARPERSSKAPFNFNHLALDMYRTRQ